MMVPVDHASHMPTLPQRTFSRIVLIKIIYFLFLQMITKSKECNDIHELCISQAEFERREKKKESIYGGAILNRRVCWFVCGKKICVLVN